MKLFQVKNIFLYILQFKFATNLWKCYDKTLNLSNLLKSTDSNMNKLSFGSWEFYSNTPFCRKQTFLKVLFPSSIRLKKIEHHAYPGWNFEMSHVTQISSNTDYFLSLLWFQVKLNTDWFHYSEIQNKKESRWYPCWEQRMQY